ncbi:type II toxin-antitoxin system RatA family toxin [Endozoicomonas gorgoniicola]|uniref:Type II toxin-antitoxin system RatA family toxin n=1 Tax=Endozoicomonas gorgoniicola TaxID=1234144 RepID=A0ABT3N2V7_9GAMM|nr:type II toxin-antitoxin system RatA family toxin [Endozoicomonas gorgoniicola]MCW7555962.1 type II toxin-antitoxin system RatA family toxin [Endozoicomonas gorgoniicola]
MSKVSRSALIMHSAEQMYDLIADVGSYPEFLPWCQRAHIFSSEENVIDASLSLAMGGLSCDFTTRNLMTRNESIEIQLLSGPFSRLQGVWTFKALMDDGCKVSLELMFELSNPVLKATVGAVFEQAMDKMIDAFCLRAHVLYGADKGSE